MDALEALAKWDRKYYSYKIETGRHIQPGDGLTVTLYGGGRKVSVNDIEMELENDEEYCPTIGEVILEAIQRWHADDSIKNYRVIYYTKPDGPDYNGEHELRCKNEFSKSIEVRVQARNEHEAKEKANSGYPLEAMADISAYVWEVNKNWWH